MSETTEPCAQSDSNQPPENKWRSFIRGCKIGVCFLVLVVTFPFFQNFMEIPLSALKPEIKMANARPVNPYDGSADIREMAPRRPASMDEPQQVIAVPQSGNDLNSIGQDWATRQAHLITGGAEQRFLDDLNKKMSRMVRFEPVESEPWPEPSTGDDDSAAAPGDVTKIRKPASTESVEPGSRSRFRPKYMRVTAVNRVEIGLANDTHVSCSFNGNSLDVNMKSPITDRMDLNVRHETNGSKSSVNLNYNW